MHCISEVSCKHKCFRERCHLCMCYRLKCILGKNDFNLGQNILNYIKLWNDFNPGKFVLSQVEMTFNVWNSSILFILKQICRPQESLDFFLEPTIKFPLSKTMHLMHFFYWILYPRLKSNLKCGLVSLYLLSLSFFSRSFERQEVESSGKAYSFVGLIYPNLIQENCKSSSDFYSSAVR